MKSISGNQLLNAKHLRTLFTAVLLAGMLVLPAIGDDGKPANRLAGTYGTGGKGAELGTPLDVARFNWGMVCFGNVSANREYTENILNKILEINPAYKFVVRLWPTSDAKIQRNGKQENAKFMDYLYDDKIRNHIKETMKNQIDSVMDYVSRPENVTGFCFEEEMPTHFSDKLYQLRNGDKIPSATLQYAGQYEKETGRKMTVVDDDLRRWWGLKFVEAMNDINAHIKKYSKGKKVYIYLMLGVLHTLDMHKDKSLDNQQLVPCYFTELIKPDVCDGLFLYPGPSWNFYVDLAKKNNWSFFSQLSYDGSMRLYSWNDTLKMVNIDTPLNQGYFLFVWSEDPAHWNAAPDMAEGNSQANIPLKLRRLGEQFNTGMDIVEKHLTPLCEVYYDITTKKEDFFLFHAIVSNPRDASWFPYRKGLATLKNVRIKLTLPEGISDLGRSPTLNDWLSLGDIKSGEFKRILFWPYIEKNAMPLGGERRFMVQIRCDNAPEQIQYYNTQASTWNTGLEYEICSSGKKMRLAIPEGYGSSKKHLKFELKCIRDICSFPSISMDDNNGKFIFNGCLRKGQTLLVYPDGKAELDGKDVSEQIYLKPFVPQDYNLNVMTYTDSDQPSIRARLHVKLSMVEGKNK